MPRAPRTKAVSGTRPVIPASVVPKLFLFGLVGLMLCLAIVFLQPAIQPTQAAVLALVLGLSGALVATAIAGVLKLRTKTMVASGPFVVFVLGFWVMISAGAPNVLPDFSALIGRSARAK
jgi:hypothetical protein